MEEGGTVLPASFSAFLSFLHLGRVFWPRLLLYTEVPVLLGSTHPHFKRSSANWLCTSARSPQVVVTQEKVGLESQLKKVLCTHTSPRRHLIISEAPPISPGESPQCCLQSLLLKRRISEVRVRRGPRRGRGGGGEGGFLLFTLQVRTLRGSSAPCWTG